MRDELLARVKQSDDLPPLPEVITTLRKMIEDNNTGIDDVARVIQSDPVLTGRLIRMANSVFGRGTTYHANSLTKALGRLGLKMAMDLAYSLNLPNLFKPNDVVDQRLFWRYSLARGIVSSKLAQHCGATRIKCLTPTLVG